MAISYTQHQVTNEEEFAEVKELIDRHLLEPYSVYVYRFFLAQWPDLCYVARDEGVVVGAIICKVESHRGVRSRGYIGMLAVEVPYRKQGIAAKLIDLSLDEMIKQGVDEIMLEAEVVNGAAIALYEKFGFVRSKRLYRYYLNQHDAYRLILPVSERSLQRSTFLTGGVA